MRKYVVVDAQMIGDEGMNVYAALNRRQSCHL